MSLSRRVLGPARPLTARQPRFLGLESIPARSGVLGVDKTVAPRTLNVLPTFATPRKKNDNIADILAEREAALQRREAELWDRQSSIVDNLQEAYEELKASHAEEKRMWLGRESDLMKENEVLRNKLLYLATRLSSGGGLLDADWVDGTPASGEIPTVTSSRDEEGPSNWLERNETDAHNETRAASKVASDFAAAFAAVEQGDILKDDPLSFVSTGTTRSAQTAAKEDKIGEIVEERAEQEDGAEIPSGPPPTLTAGADDIYWMNQLHVALVDEGYYPGDEDIEDFFFGESTQSALLTFQACNSLPETGCADEETWRALLGDELTRKQSRDLTDDMNPLTEKTAPDASDASHGSDGTKPFAELFSAETYEVRNGDSTRGITHVHDEKYFSDGHIEVTDETSSQSSTRSTWPILLEGEGGQVVHALHTLLCEAGFYPSDDELQWWQFGDSTVAAIKTFQACNGMAESGTVDARLWRLLAGDGAHPSLVDTLKSGKSDDEDLSLEGKEGMVWLIGEQRWEDRTKLSRKMDCAIPHVLYPTLSTAPQDMPEEDT
jgi:peptidoglycan hydrolase-like protein with peptidoglycan-binding domain